MNNITLKKINRVMEHIKSRATALGVTIDYYDRLERDRGYLTTDQQTAYGIALAGFYEIDNLVQFIEAVVSDDSGESGESGDSEDSEDWEVIAFVLDAGDSGESGESGKLSH